MLIGIVASAIYSEVSFRLLREVNRSPQTIELTIPPGTADQVARGEQPPTIPADMVFLVGDELVVNNQDSVAHELGPLFIPSGSSAHLNFTASESYSYSCSFQPSKRLGLDVQEPVTVGTRIRGILFGGIPLGVLIAIYSIVVRPLKAKDQTA
jgi:hypothetical protein